MKCPVDNQTLSIADRQGIEIDYCPECRGIWLDRGELDKIIERSSAGGNFHDSAVVQRVQHEDSHTGHQKKSHKKRESFLGDLFDF